MRSDVSKNWARLKIGKNQILLESQKDTMSVLRFGLDVNFWTKCGDNLDVMIDEHLHLHLVFQNIFREMFTILILQKFSITLFMNQSKLIFPDNHRLPLPE